MRIEMNILPIIQKKFFAGKPYISLVLEDPVELVSDIQRLARAGEKEFRTQLSQWKGRTIAFGHQLAIIASNGVLEKLGYAKAELVGYLEGIKASCKLLKLEDPVAVTESIKNVKDALR